MQSSKKRGKRPKKQWAERPVYSPPREGAHPRGTMGNSYLLLHGLRVPEQQPARNLVGAPAANVWCQHVHVGSEARSCSRADERGPAGAARERQDPATHRGVGGEASSALCPPTKEGGAGLRDSAKASPPSTVTGGSGVWLTWAYHH